MSREWKPGGVALVKWKALDEWREGVFIRANKGSLGSDVWWGANGWIGDHTAKEVRPLVVIDPEDREAVERLYVAAWRAFNEDPGDDIADEDVAGMQAALREFADPKPPRPDEPQGLGAVVEDAGRGLLVRSDGNEDTAAWVDQFGDFHWWADLDVTAVHHEGWRA